MVKTQVGPGYGKTQIWPKNVFLNTEVGLKISAPNGFSFMGLKNPDLYFIILYMYICNHLILIKSRENNLQWKSNQETISGHKSRNA